MPIYEFICKDCDRDSEVLVRSAEWQGTPCPHCGSTRLTKRLSVFAAAGGGADAIPDGPACTGNPSACGMCQE